MSDSDFDESDLFDVMFEMVFSDGWKFKSRKTKKTYNYDEFLHKSNYYVGTFKHFKERLNETKQYEMFPIFHKYWLKQAIYYNLLEDAEETRLSFLAENPLENLSKKESIKVLKKSESLYNGLKDNYYNKYKEF